MSVDVRDLLPAAMRPGPGSDEIRELWKRHSIAEDERDLPGLISTLTDDCVYELAGTRHSWEGHAAARALLHGIALRIP